MYRNMDRLTDAERVSRIRKIISYGDRRIRERYPFLSNFQNEIGGSIFILSIVSMLIVDVLYIQGSASAVCAVIVNMFCAALLHELEHEIIHAQYYPKTLYESCMKWGIYLFRGSAPHVDYRKYMHIAHHKIAGQRTDMEDILFGCGMKWGLQRLIYSFDLLFSKVIYLAQIKRTGIDLPEYKGAVKYVIVMHFFMFMLYFSITFYGLWFVARMLGLESLIEWLSSVDIVLRPIAILWVLPNTIRQLMLSFIASCVHYFGDVPAGPVGVLQQTQVLNSFRWLVLNIFSINVGGTHSVHHFFVDQPFFIRELGTSYAYPAFRKYGVRFNDHHCLLRANRYNMNHIPATIDGLSAQ